MNEIKSTLTKTEGLSILQTLSDAGAKLKQKKGLTGFLTKTYQTLRDKFKDTITIEFNHNNPNCETEPLKEKPIISAIGKKKKNKRYYNPLLKAGTYCKVTYNGTVYTGNSFLRQMKKNGKLLVKHDGKPVFENFDKKKGRRLALTNTLLNAPLKKVTRKLIWEQYFNEFGVTKK